MDTLSTMMIKAKRRLLEMHQQANTGHLGGNLSCIDALMTLHHRVMTPQDRFILSKGHAAGALYVTLWSLGKLTDQQLDSFCEDNTQLAGHPSGSAIPDVLFSTGSLGHGPSLAVGLALAAKHKKSPHQIYCLCSDGEWQEGSCWEALNFGVHSQLGNLTILIDQNGWQGFGSTEEVMSCTDLSARLRAFGAEVTKIDGHDPQAMIEALTRRSGDKPNIVILETVKGRGLHFSGKLESHYLPLSKEQYETACTALEEQL